MSGLPDLVQPNIAGNFLSSYYTARQQQQAEQDRARKMQREDVADSQQSQMFNMNLSNAQIEHGLKAAELKLQLLGSIAPGDAQGFEAAKAQYSQATGVPLESMANLTIAQLPQLREQGGQELKHLQLLATKANIYQSNAAANASNAQAEYVRAGKGQFGKPMPQQLQKAENDMLEKVQIAANNNADVSGIISNIDQGTLDPGILKNNYEKAKTFFGAVDPADTNTRNYNTFVSTMERLRNESLRLNKGVQTEGDAQRAWNELFTNINDKTVVRDQLARIAKLNERAARQQAGLVRNQRKTFFGANYQEPDWESLGINPSLLDNTPARTSFTRGGAGVFDQSQAGQAVAGQGAAGGWKIERVQ